MVLFNCEKKQNFPGFEIIIARLITILPTLVPTKLSSQGLAVVDLQYFLQRLNKRKPVQLTRTKESSPDSLGPAPGRLLTTILTSRTDSGVGGKGRLGTKAEEVCQSSKERAFEDLQC